MKYYVRKLVEDYGLCTWCVGRQFTKDPNKFYEIGKKIYEALGLGVKSSCWLCDGFFHDHVFLDGIWRKLSEFEFKSVDFGIIANTRKIEFEDEFRSRFKITGGLVLKKAALAYLRQKFATIYNVEIKTREPDIKVLLSIEDRKFTILAKPKILELRFLKYERDSKIRAGKCEICNGRGCSSCGWIGKARDGSLESFLLFDLSKLLGGEIRIRWSAKDFEKSTIGGLGRPIYLILKNPKRMNTAPLLIPYKPLNGFQIIVSRRTTLNEVREIFIQTTLVKVNTSRELAEDEIKRAAAFFRNRDIFTSYRNGKVKKKAIYLFQIKPLGGKTYHIMVKHDTGLNLEKFLTSEESGARIEPSFTDLFKDVRVEIEEVDVLNVEEKED